MRKLIKSFGNKTKVKMIQRVSWILFAAYIIFLFWRLFFYAYDSFYRSPSDLIQYNIVPFKTIIKFINYYKYYIFKVLFLDLFGNIMAFIPLGCLLPFIRKRVNNFKSIVFISFLFSLFAELTQLLTKAGDI